MNTAPLSLSLVSATRTRASRYWFNYRHVANTLSFYHTVKKLGIPDSQIILMLADDMGCNARNAFAGTVFNEQSHATNLYDEDIEVDYRGTDTTVENFLRLLTGRHGPDEPRSRRLLTDSNSNVLVYLTGHGGDEFLKFQDSEELSSNDLADAFRQMHEQRRYNEILFMIDTCQAATLDNQFYSPNIVSIGSSRLGENSYSHGNDPTVGVNLLDRFTHFTLDFFESRKSGKTTLLDLFSSYPPVTLMSTPEWRTDLFQRNISDTLVSDFFASVNPVKPVSRGYALSSSSDVPHARSPPPPMPAPSAGTEPSPTAFPAADIRSTRIAFGYSQSVRNWVTAAVAISFVLVFYFESR